jgi:carbonic anhydrase
MPLAKTPDQAWRALVEGNERFVAGRSEHPHQELTRRAETALKQSPFAVVFGCMDSRVAAELVFDRGIGDLAVVRTAGHVVDSGVLGSLEFGITVLEIPLVVVLGHDRCGAIAATLKAHSNGQMPGGYVRDIVERVTPSLVTGRQGQQALGDLDPDDLTEEHVRHTVHLVAERSAIIAEGLARGTCGIVGAGYRLEEGRVRVLDHMGAVDVGPDT